MKAVYPGSFDPITYGHVDLVRRSLTIADRLIVAVMANVSKRPLFTLDERVAMVRRSFKGMKRVEVRPFDGLLVDFIRQTGAKIIIRGLRAVSDFEYEFQMALMNRRLDRLAETVFLMPAESYTYLSSSITQEIARFGGNVRGLVPPHVAAALKEKFGKR